MEHKNSLFFERIMDAIIERFEAGDILEKVSFYFYDLSMKNKGTVEGIDHGRVVEHIQWAIKAIPPN